MARQSLLVRSGLWRITRNSVTRQLYDRLDAAGVHAAQLDRFERPTTGTGDVPEADHGEITLDVSPITDRRPARLDDAPLAPSDHVVLASRDGEPVGWCCLSDRPVYVPELHRRLQFPGSYLWRLYVVPEHRGRGIGTALVGRAVEHARTEDTATVDALVAPDNLPSRRAFRGLGFEPTARYTSVGWLGRRCHREVGLG